MAENTKLTSLELNGVRYGLGRSIYAELDMSLERFVELLGRDFYCPTLAAAPTSSTITYKDTDDSVNTFQIGQPCRWQEGSAWRLAVCTNNTGPAATWYILPTKVSELNNDAGYLTQHQDISHLATKQEVNAKQDTINDLATIRENASKGATALQSVPSEYITETELANKGYATSSSLNSGLSGKVDKVNGKQLSTEDFTTALKNKLSGLSNYDDAAITSAVNKLRSDFDTLVSGDTTSAIESFNEIVAFLEGVQDSGTLEGIVAGVNQEIAKKQDKISDLETIRSGAAKGATALQSYTEKYTGTYSKPSGGIPKTDLASEIQTSLGKADTALQSYTEKYTGTYSKPSGGIPKSDLASAVQTSLGKADTALQGFTETDPVFSASAAAGIKSSDITNWNSKTSNTGTITGIKMNGASKGTSGVVDLGTVITAHQDISGKVDKVSGKGLSTNDYTTNEKNKLGGIAAGAEVNVQSDWNVTDTTSDAYIKNKPTIPSAVTESTVSGWGFTKNAGTYSKPSTGIPKTDLASAVQTSLGKADTALQSHQDISGKINGDGTITKIVKVTSLPSSPNANTLYVIV